MKILSIKKMGNGRYKLTMDNDDTLILYEEVIIKHLLLIGKTIDINLQKEISEDNYIAEIYNKALQYINIRLRSREELKNYLIKKSYEENLVENTLLRLEKDSYIDDLRYAMAYVNDKLTLSNDGIGKIRKNLENYNVDESIINKVLNSVNDNQMIERIDKLINKQLRLNKKYSGNILKMKIYNYILNLGYDSNMIIDRLDKVELKAPKDAKDIYQKLYQKYSKKYSGYKLEMVIKQKLMQKGYNELDLTSIK